ncbi:MFS transporter [Dactylosporangium sp. NPDC051541]|uniref:MFS transporter n=1 Tax=Dactylosporangium sp. NPDC051541 TaxID=3363977 RepID=UPI00378B5FC9
MVTANPARAGLVILALCVFAGVTTEMLPVGLLPAVGRAVGTGDSATGLLVSLYAALVAVLAVPLTLATRRVPRKRLLLIATGCFAASNALAAVAPGYALLAVARGLGGATHAVFFAVCIGYAARLVPPERTGSALAFASAGISAGFVLGVPLATALGNAVGWRGAFAALGVLMLVLLLLVAGRLPEVEPAARDEAAGTGVRRLVAVIGSNILVYTGQYALYSYVSVLLLRAGAAAELVGPILLVFGGCGLLGVWLAGRRLDVRFRGTALVVLVVLCAGIGSTGAGFPVLALVIAGGAVWNCAFGPVASIHQTAAIRARATTEDLAGAWIVATANVGIAAGAGVGGVVLDHFGLRAVAWVAAAAVAGAAAIVLAARDAFPRTTV